MCKLTTRALSKYCGLAKNALSDIRYPVHTLEVKAPGKTTTNCPGSCTILHTRTPSRTSSLGGTWKF